jgi:hypothetical protein
MPLSRVCAPWISAPGTGGVGCTLSQGDSEGVRREGRAGGWPTPPPLREGWSVVRPAVTPRQGHGARAARRPVPAHRTASCV